MDKKFQEIEAQKKELDKKFKETLGDTYDGTNQSPDDKYNRLSSLCSQLYAMYNNLYASQNYIHQRINSTQDTHAAHLKGHLPSATPSQMKKHLENINASDDYEIQKPTISMAKINNQFVLEAAYAKK